MSVQSFLNSSSVFFREVKEKLDELVTTFLEFVTNVWNSVSDGWNNLFSDTNEQKAIPTDTSFDKDILESEKIEEEFTVFLQNEQKEVTLHNEQKEVTLHNEQKEVTPHNEQKEVTPHGKLEGTIGGTSATLKRKQKNPNRVPTIYDTFRGSISHFFSQPSINNGNTPTNDKNEEEGTGLKK